MIKMNLSLDELQIIYQLIYLNKFDGKDVIPVGLLADKVLKEIKKLEQENLTNSQSTKKV